MSFSKLKQWFRRHEPASHADREAFAEDFVNEVRHARNASEAEKEHASTASEFADKVVRHNDKPKESEPGIGRPRGVDFDCTTQKPIDSDDEPPLTVVAAGSAEAQAEDSAPLSVDDETQRRFENIRTAFCKAFDLNVSKWRGAYKDPMEIVFDQTYGGPTAPEFSCDLHSDEVDALEFFGYIRGGVYKAVRKCVEEDRPETDVRVERKTEDEDMYVVFGDIDLPIDGPISGEVGDILVSISVPGVDLARVMVKPKTRSRAATNRAALLELGKSLRQALKESKINPKTASFLLPGGLSHEMIMFFSKAIHGMLMNDMQSLNEACLSVDADVNNAVDVSGDRGLVFKATATPIPHIVTQNSVISHRTELVITWGEVGWPTREFCFTVVRGLTAS